MTSTAFLTGLPIAGIMLLAGVAFGLAYFSVLRRTVGLLTAGHGWLAPAALTLGRIAAAGLFLAIAARLGVVLVAFLGFLVARAVALRSARRSG